MSFQASGPARQTQNAARSGRRFRSGELVVLSVYNGVPSSTSRVIW